MKDITTKGVPERNARDWLNAETGIDNFDGIPVTINHWDWPWTTRRCKITQLTAEKYRFKLLLTYPMGWDIQQISKWAFNVVEMIR